MINKPLVKWFIRIVCVVMAVNIFLVGVSALIVPGMDRLVYTCSGEDACIVQLDFANRQVRYMKYASAYDNRWLVGQMSDFMAVRLKFAAAMSAAPVWFGDYSGKEADQAEAWAMDMYFGDRVRTCRGNGDIPLSYKLLVAEIMSLTQAFPEVEAESGHFPGNVPTADI